MLVHARAASNEQRRIAPPVVVVGKESVGKSALIRALTAGRPVSSNFRGSTIACQEWVGGDRVFVDTPGIIRGSDAPAVRDVLVRVLEAESVLLVVQGTHLDEDLDDLLPLIVGKRAVIAVTFWDRVAQTAAAHEALARMSEASGLPIIAIDARAPSRDALAALLTAVELPGVVRDERMPVRAGWRIEPPVGLLDRRWSGPLAALLLLIAPTVASVMAANAFAAWLEPAVKAGIATVAPTLAMLPGPIGQTLVGDFGLVTMGPLLFVWALPTVVMYALVVGAYKASGLVDRIGAALHPLLRPVGLHGRDVTRVLMGFGCNVPAVISTRSCSSCSRPGTIAAIAFGSACSYQLGATLGVFAAAGRSWLALPYLLVLVSSTLVYVRLTSTSDARSPLNVLLIEGRTFLVRPTLADVWRDARASINEFLRRAMPIFLVVCVIASVLSWTGVVGALADVIAPSMAVFHLPREAALPTLLAGVRKDAILLLAQGDLAESLSDLQLLVAVFLAGTLLPCLVTALTIGRLEGVRFVARLLARQALVSVAVAGGIAWAGLLLSGGH